MYRRARRSAQPLGRNMNAGGQIQDHIQALIRLLAPHCRDRTTMDGLAEMLSDERSWPKAHDLFNIIRRKTLGAGGSRGRLESQFLFEEICAKTIYNLSLPDDPFDVDSPYWVVPMAIAFARCVGVPDAKVIALVAA
jgi:hypothetical protein